MTTLCRVTHSLLETRRMLMDRDMGVEGAPDALAVLSRLPIVWCVAR